MLNKTCLDVPFLVMALILELLTAETVLVFTKEALHVLTGAGKKGGSPHACRLQIGQLSTLLAVCSLCLCSFPCKALGPHSAGRVCHSPGCTCASPAAGYSASGRLPQIKDI